MNIGPDRNRARQIGFYVLIAMLLIATIWAMTRRSATETLTYSEVIELFENEKVEKFAIDTDGNLTMDLREEYKGSKTYTHRVGAFSIFYNDLNETIRAQKEAGTLTEYDYPPAQEVAWWVEKQNPFRGAAAETICRSPAVRHWLEGRGTSAFDTFLRSAVSFRKDGKIHHSYGFFPKHML